MYGYIHYIAFLRDDMLQKAAEAEKKLGEVKDDTQIVTAGKQLVKIKFYKINKKNFMYM